MVTPEGIFSILDTDLYKLTMQCAVLKYFRDTPVTYSFANRTPDMKLSIDAFEWLEDQVSRLANICLTDEEYAYLQKTCGYLDHGDYLSFLRSFRFKPATQIKLSFQPLDSDPTHGSVNLQTQGLWVDTILYEIPLLALFSEAYFKFVDRDWTYDQQEARAYAKGKALIQGGCVFSEFGSRRRRDHKTQDLVLQGLSRAQKDFGSSKGSGKLSGTSNVHFAMKFGVSPVGTVAHEWFMGIAASTADYKGATAKALEYWISCFGRGVLGIALTDTFGTTVFLDTFKQPLPEGMRGLAEGWVHRTPRFADVFVGTRQDSGDPRKFIKIMKKFYDEQGITDTRTIVFSDSLNVEKCLLYKKKAEKRGFQPSFGVGTFLTNERFVHFNIHSRVYLNVENRTDKVSDDFMHASDMVKKSKPLNIVIKISSAGGHPAIKLSDDLGKNTGDNEAVKMVKKQLGYVDEHWEGADEASRWDQSATVGEQFSDSDDN